MKTTVIFAHPYDGSFNKAIFDRVTQTLRNSDTPHTIIDLYRDEFDPVLSKEELSIYNKGRYLDPLVEEYCKILDGTSRVIFVFPIWWYDFPAILKGFFDKVMLEGSAYHEDEMGMHPLRNIEETIIFTTSSAPTEALVRDFGDTVNGMMIGATFKAIGFHGCKWHNLGLIGRTTEAERISRSRGARNGKNGRVKPQGYRSDGVIRKSADARIPKPRFAKQSCRLSKIVFTISRIAENDGRLGYGHIPPGVIGREPIEPAPSGRGAIDKRPLIHAVFDADQQMEARILSRYAGLLFKPIPQMRNEHIAAHFICVFHSVQMPLEISLFQKTPEGPLFEIRDRARIKRQRFPVPAQQVTGQHHIANAERGRQAFGERIHVDHALAALIQALQRRNWPARKTEFAVIVVLDNITLAGRIRPLQQLHPAGDRHGDSERKMMGWRRVNNGGIQTCQRGNIEPMGIQRNGRRPHTVGVQNLPYLRVSGVLERVQTLSAEKLHQQAEEKFGPGAQNDLFGRSLDAAVLSQIPNNLLRRSISPCGSEGSNNDLLSSVKHSRINFAQVEKGKFSVSTAFVFNGKRQSPPDGTGLAQSAS